MQGAWVRFLVGDLRYHIPHSMAKKKKKKENLLRVVPTMKTITMNNYVISVKVLSQTYSGWVKMNVCLVEF